MLCDDLEGCEGGKAQEGGYIDIDIDIYTYIYIYILMTDLHCCMAETNTTL